jgi:hypothetical protein
LDRSIEDPVVIKQVLAHFQRKAEPNEYNPLPENRAPPQIEFVRIIDETNLTQSTHQIAASKSSGRQLVCLVDDCGGIDRREGAPKVGALGDVGHVGGIQSDFDCSRAGRRRQPRFFIGGMVKIGCLYFLV